MVLGFSKRGSYDNWNNVFLFYFLVILGVPLPPFLVGCILTGENSLFSKNHVSFDEIHQASTYITH